MNIDKFSTLLIVSARKVIQPFAKTRHHQKIKFIKRPNCEEIKN